MSSSSRCDCRQQFNILSAMRVVQPQYSLACQRVPVLVLPSTSACASLRIAPLRLPACSAKLSRASSRSGHPTPQKPGKTACADARHQSIGPVPLPTRCSSMLTCFSCIFYLPNGLARCLERACAQGTAAAGFVPSRCDNPLCKGARHCCMAIVRPSHRATGLAAERVGCATANMLRQC